MKVCSNIANHILHPFSCKGPKLKKWEAIVAIGAGILLSPVLVPFYVISSAIKATKHCVNGEKTSKVAEERFTPSEGESAAPTTPFQKTSNPSSPANEDVGTSGSSNNDNPIHKKVLTSLQKNKSFQKIKDNVQRMGNWNRYVEWLRENDIENFHLLFKLALSERRDEVSQFLSYMNREELEEVLEDKVELMFGDNKLYVSKELLCYYIPYFQSMFHFGEVQNVDLNEINYEVFSRCLDYLFFHEPLGINGENFSEYLHVADYFQLLSLKQEYGQWISDHIDEFDDLKIILKAISIYQLSHPTMEKHIKNKVSKRAQDLFDRIAKSEEPSEVLRRKLEKLLPFASLHCSTDDHLEYIVAHFPNIIHLSLREARQITHKGWALLAKLQNLQTLDLQKTLITNRELPHIANLITLQHLDLNYTDITDDGLKNIANLMSLQYLGLSHTKVTDNGLKNIANLVSLQYLDLSHTKITDGGLENVANLTSLLHLDISHTRKTGEGLIHLTTLTALKHLVIRHLWISNAELAHIANLTTLQYLDLGRTNITDAKLMHIANLTALQYLDLSYTKITDTGLPHIANLTSLQHLDLKGTHITDAKLMHIANLTALQYLDLSDTNIISMRLALIAKLTTLQYLNLGKVRISNEGLKDIANLTALQHLDLKGTNITDTELTHIANLTALQHLDLSCCTMITDAGLASIANLTALRYLNLCLTKISNKGLVHLANLRSLEHLNLNTSKITDAGLAYISNLTMLKTLYVGKKITDAGVMSLTSLIALQSLYINYRLITNFRAAD